jgi:hypothetical protein
MKKAGFSFNGFISISILAFLLASAPSMAQFYVWQPQKALTDSFADNTNPCVASYYGSDYRDHKLLFWERSVDSSSTAIYYRNIGNGVSTDPVELLSAPGVHFTNPKAMVLPYYFPGNDTSLILFYESDASGSKDIYFMKYYLNNNFTEPQLFSALPGNDEGLSTAGGEYPYAIWENEGKILESHLISGNQQFSAAVVLSASGASSPAATDNILSWIQQENDSSKVVYLNRVYQSGNIVLEGPYTLYSQGENSRLNSCKGFNNFGNYGMLTWQGKTNGSPWRIRLGDVGYSGPAFNEFGSPSFNYHSPDLFDFPIIIKFPTFMTFVTDSLGNEEVMTCEPSGGEFMDLINQSNFPGPDRNPCFFGTTDEYIFEIQLLWESLRNGHWTIFNTHYDMIFGTEENSAANSLSAFPNPFTNQTTVNTGSGLSEQGITVYTMLMVPVRHLKTTGNIHQGENAFTWDGRDDKGFELPSGIYIIRLNGIQGPKSVKVVKN